MQVNSKVGTGCEASYERNKNAKHGAGIIQKKWDSFLSGEAEENPEEAEFVDNSEFHKVRMSQGAAGNRGIRSAEEEVSYQTGAQSFTEDEWDEFLGKFDVAEEVLRNLMRERHAKEKEERLQKELLERAKPMKIEMLLFAESTTCIYPAPNPADGELRYITWYTKEGIFCKRTGKKGGYEWSVTFKKKEQYCKVIKFIGQFPSDCNMRFASREEFWTAFLNDEIDTNHPAECLSSELWEKYSAK